MKNTDLKNKKGIYIAFPSSSELQSIFKQQDYKTKVNNMHTKFGISNKCLEQRKKCYVDNFGAGLTFIPFILDDSVDLDLLEKKILSRLKELYNTVGRSREWFNTTDRNQILQIIRENV